MSVRDTMTQEHAIACHTVRVHGRPVHYRRSGNGPAVVLLHQTPQSSKTMEPLMRRFGARPGARCTTIALDSPGFGLSERLPGDVWTMDQLCDWLAATLDALGIERAAFCGQHTGATIATEFAVRHPARVAALACDGYTAFTQEECTSILPHQLYRFTPAWDGSHLVWAWSRFRDGWMFFPWSVRTRERRRDVEMPDAAHIQSWQIIELLRSRENHLAIYPPVFEWNGPAAARALKVPALLAGTRDDQLYPHLDRLGGVGANVELLRLPVGAREALENALVAFICGHLEKATAPGQPPDAAADEHGNLLTNAEGLTLRWKRFAGAGEILVALHGAGESSVQALQAVEGRHAGPIAAFDLPGHGESAGAVLAPAEAAARVAKAIQSAKLARMRLWGRGYGAAVAAELARLAGDAVVHLELEELRLLEESERTQWLEQYAHPIVPEWDGTHLVRLWNEIRDREFFTPWFRRTREAIRKVEPDVDAERLTQRVFAALLCTDWPGAHRAWLEWRVERLKGLRCPMTFTAAPGDGWARDLDKLRALV
jgi:pimeloyl-ACP methyl ester carboxylesterase